MLDYVIGMKSSVETFVLEVLMITDMGKFVNVVMKQSPHGEKMNNVAQQIEAVEDLEHQKDLEIEKEQMCPVLKEKSYQGMQNVMGNALKDLDWFLLPLAKTLQHAMSICRITCVMD